MVLSSSDLDSGFPLISFAPRNHLRQYAVTRTSCVNNENLGSTSLATSDVTEVIKTQRSSTMSASASSSRGQVSDEDLNHDGPCHHRDLSL